MVNNGKSWPIRPYPKRGDFGWQVLASAFEPTAEDMDSDRSYWGMPPEALYLWGTLRDEDGNMYSPMRRIPYRVPGAKPDTRRYFFLQTTEGTNAYVLHPIGRNSAPNDNYTRTRDGNTVRWRSAPDVKGNPFLVEWTPKTCRWVEDGAMDVTGTLIEPGMQWYMPGRDSGFAYIANIFLLDGTCLGRKVRGLIGFDIGHMYPGGEVYKTHDPLVQEKVENLWYTWATIYKDGSLDAGHFFLGNDLAGFAILTDEKESTRFTYDVEGEVAFEKEGYWQIGARFSALGEQWEFLPDPKGRMPGLGPIPNPQVEGRWRKVGDTREPDVWFAWGEAAPSHGARSVNRFSKIGRRVVTPQPRFAR